MSLSKMTITFNPKQSQKLYERIVDTTEKPSSLEFEGVYFNNKQLNEVHDIISINRAKVLGTILELGVEEGKVKSIRSESVKIHPNAIPRKTEHIFK